MCIYFAILFYLNLIKWEFINWSYKSQLIIIIDCKKVRVKKSIQILLKL